MTNNLINKMLRKVYSLCKYMRPSAYRQWIKSGTGLCWLKDAASRFIQISTLSPAMIRTAALFSSSNVCLCKDAHSSNIKSSGSTKMLDKMSTANLGWVYKRLHFSGDNLQYTFILFFAMYNPLYFSDRTVYI